MFKGKLEGDLEKDLKWDLKGDFRGDLEGDLLSISGQLRSRSRSGLVQVWSRSGPGLVQYRLKFNSFELDSEVTPVHYTDQVKKNTRQFFSSDSIST